MTTPYIDPNLIFASNAPVKDKPAKFNNYDKGWDESRKDEGRPSISQMNYIGQQADLKNLYIHENGAALPYKEGIAYEENAHVVKDGELQKFDKVKGEWKPTGGARTDAELATWSGITQEKFNKRNATLSDFGAVDSETIDSTSQVKNYLDFCSSIGVSASFYGYKHLAIDANAKIEVTTNLDFCGCVIVPLNGVQNPPVGQKTMFIVTDPETPLITQTDIVLSIENVKHFSFFPTKGVYEKTGFASITCNFPMSNRDRDGLMDYTQPFWLVGGQAKLPLIADLTQHNTVTLRTRDASNSRLKISNPVLLDNGFTNLKFLSIERNQTDADEILVIATTERAEATLDALVALSSVGDCEVVGLKCSARPYVSSIGGTYGLTLRHCAEIRLTNCIGVDGIQSSATWGVTGSNFVNGLYVNNCSFNRIDVHAMGFNIFVNGGSYNKTCLTVGNGGGIFSIGGDINLFDCAAFKARTDYGAHYINSKVLVDKVNWSVTDISTPLVDFSPSRSIGAAVPMYCPDISIKNITEVNSNASAKQRMVRVIDLRIRKSSVAVYPPNFILVDGVEFAQKTQWNALLDLASMEQLGSTISSSRISFRNIGATTFGSFIGTMDSLGVIEADNPKTVTTLGAYRFRFQNCRTLALWIKIIEPLEVLVSESTATHLTTKADKPVNYELYGVNFTGNSSYTPVNKVLGRSISNPSYMMRMVGCTTIGASGLDLSSANYLTGCVVSDADTLPASATKDLAFYGFKRA